MNVPAEGLTRVRQAYAVLIWQKGLPKAAIKLKEYEKRLEEAVGSDAMRALRAMPEADLEPLRFFAERLYAKSRSLEEELASLLSVLLGERLREELRDASASLKKAEVAGDQAQIERLLLSTRLLTARIAELSRVR